MDILEEYEVEPEAELGEDVPGFRLHSSEFDGDDEPTAVEGQPAQAPSAPSEAQPQYVIPEVIKSFLLYFHRHLKEQTVYEIHSIYENSFNKLTEKYFKTTPWPPAEAVAPLVENDKIFIILYKELYYRHIYSKLAPTIAHRFESWQNYCDLFDLLLAADVHLELDLPSQWIWDIVDEFIYQFQSFCQYASKLRSKGGDEELEKLKANPKLWNATEVLGYLNRIIEKSQILRYLERERTGQEHSIDDFSNHPVYRLLGYFCIVGLLRVHCLFGNYWLGLKMLDPIDLSKKGLYSRVTACQISLYYYMGFAYLMLRRYVDAIKTFTSILLYISRTKQYHTRSYQFEMIIKKNEQMYALLGIAVSLCPQRIDENIHSVLKDKFSDKMARMQRSEGSVAADIEDLFFYACPKFISPCPLAEGPQQEPFKHQSSLFMAEVTQQLSAQLPTIRSYLKLYTTIPVSKLANFLDTPEATFASNLLCFKHKTRSRIWPGQGSLLSGRLVSSSDVDFYIEKDMIHIADSKATRRYGEFFIRHIVKFSDLLRNFERARVEGATA